MAFERKLRLIDGGSAAPAAIDAGDEAVTVRVAFASADRKHVDQHFGAAQGFVIYRIGAARYDLEEAAQFGRLDMDGNEDKLAAKIAALTDCVAVYCQAVGASAIGQLKTHGIQPIKVPPDTLISGLLRDLQQELRDGPSAWLARAIERRSPRADRFDAMEAEGWSE
ncbi:NifB/NifX family molybdenum-iron cluster-binding protein [Thiohalocapsa sp. ML1]|jgi:nitrogen fixation protein NifX|uniref:NifB/NifX family molybdenum-iron cluster-binding protein n=1 Tax=Thiohalocapsa sp. ML1 TaxID=1431688 RepID=UPI0007320A97|nr:NifB/NifX family molybdenum-iron cluster-binding protein [Thiohalocapsa sp. ML1]